MTRRTPPAHYWAMLLSTTLGGGAAASADGEISTDELPGVDALVSGLMVDLERHAESAAVFRTRARTMHADAVAALRAVTPHDEAPGPAHRAPGDVEASPSRVLDVRR